MNHKSPSETLYDQEDVDGCRDIGIQYLPNKCENTRQLIQEYLYRFCDVRDVQRIDMDIPVKGRNELRSAKLKFFTHAQARQAEWRMNNTDFPKLRPRLAKTLRCYPVFLSLCVEGNPRDIGHWEKEPKQKIVERWRSPAWVKQETNDMGHEMLQVQIVEAKKGCFSDPIEKRYDTDYALQLPYRGIHDVSFSVPSHGEDFCTSMKMRLIHPPDVFRWDLDISTLHGNLKRIDSWRYRCTTCNSRNVDEKMCESCGDTKHIVSESPGNIIAECPMGISCKKPNCEKHLKRDLFSGNSGKTWINPLLRRSLQPKATDDTLAQWKLHCRTFDEPETHLLQHIGECWVWVITFYTKDMKAIEDFKAEIQGSVQVNEPDETNIWQRNLPMFSSNSKVQKTYRLERQVTFQMGIQLWASDMWPDSKANVEKYLFEDNDSLLKYGDGIDRFNQAYALQSILSCFPSPIIREEILPYYQTGVLIDPDPGPSKKNRFFTHLQRTYLKDNYERNVEVDVDYCMCALQKMREKFSDDERKYTAWFNRHHDKDIEQNRFIENPGPSYYVNQTLGRHPEAFLQRAEDFYTEKEHENNLAKRSKREIMDGKKMWVKDVIVTPTRIDYRLRLVDDCRLFRTVDSKYCAQIHIQEDWCVNKEHRRPWFWKKGVGFNIAAQALMDNGEHGSGIPMIGGFRFRHLFYSTQQVERSSYWAFAEWNDQMLAPKVGGPVCRPRVGPHVASEVVKKINTWKECTNIGNKMSRAADYYVNGGVGVAWQINGSSVEFIQDRFSMDGRPLTSGCGLISDNFVRDVIQKHERFSSNNIAMIEGKYKGFKGMWTVLPLEVFQKVLDEDDQRLASAGKKIPQRKRTKDVIMILPQSMTKFWHDGSQEELEVKSVVVTGCAETSREIIGVMAAHDTLYPTLKKYLGNYCQLLKRVLGADKWATKTYVEELRLSSALATVRQLQRNKRDKRHSSEYEEFWENLKFSKRSGVRSVRNAFVRMKNGFNIMLRYPSVRMKAVVDWTGTLKPGEVFMKTRILESAEFELNHLNFEWTCPRCLTKKSRRAMSCCSQRRQARMNEYLVYEGEIGLAKRLCQHPSKYIRARAIYNQYLDKVFPCAEVLLLCGQNNAEYSLVSKLSNGSREGDGYLVVTQPDLLPKKNFSKVPELVRKEESIVMHDGLPTNEERLNYFVNYQADNMVSIISHYHESWSNKFKGVLNEECLELARLHLVALDYSSNTFKVELDENSHLKRIKFPHYLRYPQTMSQKYTNSLKGKLWDSCVIPQVLKADNFLWYKRNFGSMDKHLPRKELRKKPRKTPPYCKDCGNRTFRSKLLLEEHYKTTEHMIRRQEKLQDSLGLEGSAIAKQFSESHMPSGRKSQNISPHHNQQRKVPQSGSGGSGISRNHRVSMASRSPIRHRSPSLQKGNNRGTTPPAIVRDGKRRVSDREPPDMHWEHRWEEKQSWQDNGSRYEQEELWDATLSFQFLVNTERGPMWNAVEDLTTVLELNAIWREHLRGNTDDLTWKCEKFGYVYDLRKKTRSRRNLRPLRWGTLDVLEKSHTAHLVTDLKPLTLKQWCGYIESPQAAPKWQLPHYHQSQQPQQLVIGNIEYFHPQVPLFNPSIPVHKATYPSQTYLSPHSVRSQPLKIVANSAEDRPPSTPIVNSEPLEVVEGNAPLIKKVAQKEEEKTLNPAAKPFLPTSQPMQQQASPSSHSQGSDLADKQESQPPQYSIWGGPTWSPLINQNAIDIPKSNTFWTPPPSRNGQSHQTDPFSSLSIQSQEQESLVYPFEKRQNLTEMNEVDVTRDVHYISTKKKIEEITQRQLTADQLNKYNKMWIQIRGIESPQNILQRFINEQILI